MEIKILFNSHAISNEFLAGWGFSALIGDHILFDTGESGEYLLQNMQRLHMDISLIEAVIISHDHWDHTGGLWAVLEKRKGIQVFSCPHFGSDFKRRVSDLGGQLTEVDRLTEIEENIWITGEIQGTYTGLPIAEQAVVIKSKKGMTVITGCAHPGVLQIMKKIRDECPKGRFYQVLGGFHLMNTDPGSVREIIKGLQRFNIQKIGPTHCTGEAAEALFKEIYAERYIPVKIGQMIEA